MTRRKFIHQFVGIVSAGTVGFARLTGNSTKRFLSGLCAFGKAAPRKFVWAYRAKKYPGAVKPMHDIGETSKWSG